MIIKNNKKTWYQRLWLRIAAIIGVVVILSQFTNSIEDILSFFKKFKQEEIKIVGLKTFKDCKSNKSKYFKLDTISKNPKYNSLSDYFINSNLHFFDNIEKNIEERNFIGITFLTSGAGSGKSFLIRKMKYEDCEVIKVDLPFIANRERLNITHFELLPDLVTTNTDNNYTFNELPALKNSYSFTFDSLLKWSNLTISFKKPLIFIIDGIDEMHPVFSEAILDELVIFLNEKKKIQKHSIQVIISCRPEGLKPYLVKKPNSEGISFTFHQLIQPKFDRVADLKQFINDFNSLPNIQDVDSKTTICNIIDSYCENNSLLYNFGSLDLGNSVIELCSKRSYKKTELYLKLKESILSRNREKMGRPDKDNKIYDDILKAIVIKYCSKVDAEGFFQVGPNEEITVIGNGNLKFTVNVSTYLDRSGLAIIKPVSHRIPSYKFEPSWITELY